MQTQTNRWRRLFNFNMAIAKWLCCFIQIFCSRQISITWRSAMICGGDRFLRTWSIPAGETREVSSAVPGCSRWRHTSRVRRGGYVGADAAEEGAQGLTGTSRPGRVDHHRSSSSVCYIPVLSCFDSSGALWSPASVDRCSPPSAASSSACRPCLSPTGDRSLFVIRSTKIRRETGRQICSSIHEYEYILIMLKNRQTGIQKKNVIYGSKNSVT